MDKDKEIEKLRKQDAENKCVYGTRRLKVILENQKIYLSKRKKTI